MHISTNRLYANKNIGVLGIFPFQIPSIVRYRSKYCNSGRLVSTPLHNITFPLSQGSSSSWLPTPPPPRHPAGSNPPRWDSRPERIISEISWTRFLVSYLRLAKVVIRGVILQVNSLIIQAARTWCYKIVHHQSSRGRVSRTLMLATC